MSNHEQRLSLPYSTAVNYINPFCPGGFLCEIMCVIPVTIAGDNNTGIVIKPKRNKNSVRLYNYLTIGRVIEAILQQGTCVKHRNIWNVFFVFEISNGGSRFYASSSSMVCPVIWGRRYS